MVDADLFDYTLELSLPIGGESTRIEIGPGQLVIPSGDAAEEEHDEDSSHDATTPVNDGEEVCVYRHPAAPPALVVRLGWRWGRGISALRACRACRAPITPHAR